MPDANRRTARRIAGFLFGNWFSRAYLAIVVLTAVWVVIQLVSWEGFDANLAPVWLFIVTAPWSVALVGLIAPLDDVPPTWLWPALLMAVSALANTAIISGIVAAVRHLTAARRPERDSRPDA